jgi:TIR domain/C-terminal of Roc, COR, domain
VIYEILEKEKDEFDETHVAKVVAKNGLSTDLWIEIMKKFELIFEIERRGTKKYVAPQYLPATCTNPEAYEMVIENKQMPHSFTINYPKFLPKSNFLRLIARFGSANVKFLYWKNGFVFFHNNKTIFAECISTTTQREIRVSIQDGCQETAAQIFSSIVDIDPAIDLEVSLDHKNFVNIDKLLQKVKANNQEIESVTGETLRVDSFKFLFEKEILSEFLALQFPARKIVKIFVSYSSKDHELQRILIKGLRAHLDNRHAFSFELWTDDAIDMGANWRQSLSDNLQQSQAAIVLVSASFATSKFIREEELGKFLRRKKEDKYLVLPVLMRDFDFKSFEQLTDLQFFKPYYKDYDFTTPTQRDQLMPFDALGENNNTTDRQLNTYYKNLADTIYEAVVNHFHEFEE